MELERKPQTESGTAKETSPESQRAASDAMLAQQVERIIGEA